MSPQDELPERRHLRALLAAWDPLRVGELGLAYQPDLYDGLIEPLLHRLGSGADRHALAGFLSHELRDEFGQDPDQALVDEFVVRLRAWHAEEFGTAGH